MIEDPESAFYSYMRAFETLDLETALPFYHIPSMFIAPQGVFMVQSIEIARALISQFMDQLRNQSYLRTDVAGLTVRRLSQGLASCAGTFVRFNEAGEEIGRIGFAYTMRNADFWKIIVAALHDPVAE